MTRGLENTDSQIRGRLIDSALEIIDRDGIDGARLRDIVEHAGMTTGSLYWFFKNRRALINAALSERYIRKMRQLTDAAEDIIPKGLVVGDPLDLVAEITVRVSDSERVLARRERVQVLAAALDDPILAKQVADVQQVARAVDLRHPLRAGDGHHPLRCRRVQRRGDDPVHHRRPGVGGSCAGSVARRW